MSKLSDCLKDVFFPRDITCIRCGRELNDNERSFSACESCMKTCEKPRRIAEDFLDKGNPKVRLVTFYAYMGLPQYIVLNAKDFGKPFLTEYEARFFSKGFMESGITADYLTFIPSSKKVIRRRGYDPMLSVAKVLSKLISVPAIRAFERKDASKDMTELNLSERFDAVKDSYSLILPKNSLSGKKIIIIDDVITTGSTARACVNLIKETACESIIFAAFTQGKSLKD